MRFDVEKAQALKTHIEEEMARIEAIVKPQLPPRKLKKSEEAEWTLPKKPYKLDGTYSALMARFAERHGITLNSDRTMTLPSGASYPVIGGFLIPVTVPMDLGNAQDMKDWLLGQNWQPTFWNYEKGPDGKPKRGKNGQYVKTSPKIQENGRICPSLEAMQGELVRHLCKWLSYRNRLAVVEGWLENRRIPFDGRLTAGISGITNTHRVKHQVVANVPKADDSVLLGKEFRELFCADEGEVCIGYDAAGIESRVEAHFCYRYPGGPEYAEELLNGDVHTATAIRIFGVELDGIECDKENPEFKPFRHKAKTVKYAVLYGAQPRKIAATLDVSQQRGEEIYEAFWDAAPPLKQFKEQLLRFWEFRGGKRFVLGIDGRKLWTRSQHSVMNTLFQNTGAVVMEMAAVYMDAKLGGLTMLNGTPVYRYKGGIVKRRIQYHDEVLWTAPSGLAEEIGQMGIESIRWAGKKLGMRVPLDGDYKIGHSWKDVH